MIEQQQQCPLHLISPSVMAAVTYTTMKGWVQYSRSTVQMPSTLELLSGASFCRGLCMLGLVGCTYRGQKESQLAACSAWYQKEKDILLSCQDTPNAHQLLPDICLGWDPGFSFPHELGMGKRGGGTHWSTLFNVEIFDLLPSSAPNPTICGTY